MTAAKARQPPAVLGRFQLGPMIGQGGMGAVYRATDTQSGAEVAVKVVTTPRHTDLSALRAEVEALRGIHHPGVVRIIDEGLEQGELWFAMELLEGQTLADVHHATWQRSVSGVRLAPTAPNEATSDEPDVRLTLPSQRTPTPRVPRVAAAGRLSETLQIYHRLCEPLGYVHSRGVVHKDLKPSNIFIKRDGKPVLFDFGLVTRATRDSGREALGRTDVAFGTVGYASPEQIRRELVDARSDLYSLGCLLYESLTGALPFEGNSASDILQRHLDERPEPPSALVAGVPPELDRLVLALLQKSRLRRIGHANEVATRLESILASLGHDVPQSVRSPAYLYRPQLIGREPLLSRLLEAASAVKDGRGGLILVRGESGIGKTFLVSEFVRYLGAQKLRVVTGECLPGGVATQSILRTGGTLAPFKNFLQVVADQCRTLPLETAQQLLGQEASALSPYDPMFAGMAREFGRRDLTLLPSKAGRARVMRAMEALVTSFAQLGPLVLVIDDLQWADELSLSFLEHIRDRLQSHAVLVLATCRSEEMPENVRSLSRAPDVESVVLGRLGTDDVRRIVSEMLAMADPPEDLVFYVARQSEGNPFFIGEHLRMMYAEGLLVHDAGRWSVDPERRDYDALPLPSSLEQLVLLRLSRLSERVRTVVQAAAVMGRVFSLDGVASMCELEVSDAEARLSEAIDGQVVETTSERRFRFSHDKLREFAYADLPEPRRRELHLTAALALEGEHGSSPSDLEVVTTLLRHFRYARRDDKTLHYLGVAGELALAQSAHQEAIEFLGEAIQMEERQLRPGRALRLARWERQLSEALQGLGDPVESMNHLERAATHLGCPLFVDFDKLLPRMTYQLLRQAAHRLLPRRIVLMRQQNKPELLEAARIHDLLLQVCLHRGDLVRGLYACLNTLNLTEVTPDTAARAVAYSNGQIIASLLPWRGLTEAYYRQARATIGQASDPLAASYFHMTEGVYRSGVGQWDVARRELDQGLRLATEMSYERRVGDITGMLSVLFYLKGEYDQAGLHAVRQLEERDREDSQLEFRGRLLRGQVATRTGSYDAALADVEQAMSLLDAVGIPDRIWAHGIAALSLARLARQKEAFAEVQRSLSEMSKGPVSAHHAVAGYVATAEAALLLWALEKRRAGSDAPTTRERRKACQRALRAVASCARVYPVAKPALALLRGLFEQLRERPSRAHAHWVDGVRLAETLDMPYEEARLHAVLADLVGCGTSDERQASQERAAVLAKRLGVELASV